MNNDSISQKLIETASQEVFNMKAEVNLKNNTGTRSNQANQNSIEKKGFSDRLLEIN